MNFTGGRLFLPRCPRIGLGQPRFLHELDQADLRRVVSVFGLRLVLRDHAGPGLQNGGRMHVALVVEELRHADFLAQNSGYFCHFSSPLQLGRMAHWLGRERSPRFS